jgi:uncharacterized membrane protein YphA (DoxX/SURF4 family)
MMIAATILSLVLIVFFGMLGGAKVIQVPAMVERVTHLGYTVQTCRKIGGLELAAAVGLLVGFFWWPITVAAVVCLMVGAIAAHFRAGEGWKATLPAVWLGAIALAAGVLTVLAMAVWPTG